MIFDQGIIFFLSLFFPYMGVNPGSTSLQMEKNIV